MATQRVAYHPGHNTTQPGQPEDGVIFGVLSGWPEPTSTITVEMGDGTTEEREIDNTGYVSVTLDDGTEIDRVLLHSDDNPMTASHARAGEGYVTLIA